MKRRDRKALRKLEAEQRQAARDQRAPEEQLAILDGMFGKGNGAKKERARLLKQIAEHDRGKEAKKEEAQPATG